MEKTHQAYEQWSFSKLLVITAARQLSADFSSGAAQAELVGALKAESRARAAFERALKAESGS